MCDRWRASYSNFIEDMGKCPDGFTLERKDVNGNYEPGNCIWESLQKQARNKQRTIYVDEAKTLTLADWCEQNGVSYKAEYQRRVTLKKGGVFRKLD
jgi:hypothetical protein